VGERDVVGCDRHEAVGFVGGIILREVIAETEVACILDAACKRQKRCPHRPGMESSCAPAENQCSQMCRGFSLSWRRFRSSEEEEKHVQPPKVIPAIVALALIPN
jgi:hypothetical protein